MRTTLDLDRALLEEAKAALGAESFTEAIEMALRQAVSRTRAAEAWRTLEGSDLSWESIEELNGYRRTFGDRPL